jgi:hypothetical protein
MPLWRTRIRICPTCITGIGIEVLQACKELKHLISMTNISPANADGKPNVAELGEARLAHGGSRKPLIFHGTVCLVSRHLIQRAQEAVLSRAASHSRTVLWTASSDRVDAIERATKWLRFRAAFAMMKRNQEVAHEQ